MARTARKTGMALVWHIAGLAWTHPGTARLRGGVIAASGAALAVAFATYNAADPSLNAASSAAPTNALGGPGAALADIGVQSLGLASAFLALTVVVLGLCRAAASDPAASRAHLRLRALIGAGGILAVAAALAMPAPPAAWPLAKGLGGFWGDSLLSGVSGLLAYAHLPFAKPIAAAAFLTSGLLALGYAIGLRPSELRVLGEWLTTALTPQPKTPVGAAFAKPERAAKVPRRATAARPVSPTPRSIPRPREPKRRPSPSAEPPRSSRRNCRPSRAAARSARPSRPSSS